jgi:dsRNA-specific ribonuclease
MMEAGEPGKPLARGTGSTKKLAEQDAAHRALDKLARQKAGQPGEAKEEEAEE